MCHVCLVQVVEDGYEFFAKRQLVTLFSAPNYCGEFDNAGAMMSVDETLMCSFQILKVNPEITDYHRLSRLSTFPLDVFELKMLFAKRKIQKKSVGTELEKEILVIDITSSDEDGEPEDHSGNKDDNTKSEKGEIELEKEILE